MWFDGIFVFSPSAKTVIWTCFFFPTPAWAMKFWTSLSIKSKKIQRETARRRTEALRGIQIKAARPRFKNNQAGRPATNSFITLVMKARGARMLSQFEVTVSKLAATFHHTFLALAPLCSNVCIDCNCIWTCHFHVIQYFSPNLWRFIHLDFRKQ